MIVQSKAVAQFTQVKVSGRLGVLKMVQINPARVDFLELIDKSSTAVHVGGKRLVVRGNLKMTASRLGFEI